jgi:hypothetical protein
MQNGTASKSDIWTRVIGAGVGAAVIALQGINISETSGQTIYIQRLDTALKQQLALVDEINQEGKRVDAAIINQGVLIENQSKQMKLLEQILEQKVPNQKE